MMEILNPGVGRRWEAILLGGDIDNAAREYWRERGIHQV